MLRVAFAAALVCGGYAAGNPPAFPAEWSGVIVMRMPYIPLEMPLRIASARDKMMVEYYNGLEAHWLGADGTFLYLYNNSQRQCFFIPPSSGPTIGEGLAAPPVFKPLPFLPDLSQYTRVSDELVGGIMCQKFTLDAKHGSIGTMDDHLAFYWDPVLEKPVRWHMHSRHVTFGSHTDEYIMDFLSFQPGAPAASDFEKPAACKQPQVSNRAIPLRPFLEAARSLRVPPAASAQPLLFEAYLQQRGKSYHGEELEARRGIFHKNLQLIAAMNEQHGGKATFRGNQFLDMTKEEVLGFRGGKSGRATREERRTEEHNKLVRSFEAAPVKDLPTDFDWRVAKPGSVSPVKDQAMCGSCWTYGLTEPIESIQAVKTGRLVELPEQYVLDCTWTNSTEYLGMNGGCGGGNSDVGAFEIIRKFGGVIPTAKAYGSYLSVNGYCKDIRLMEVGAKITGWVDVKKRDEQGLLQALVSQGPLSIGIQVPDEMLSYDGGVLKVDSCKNNENQIDHAVTLTGFGTENGVEYYTIRNSWSTYWGDQGYIKIARGDLDCCVSCQAGYPEVEAVGTALVV